MYKLIIILFFTFSLIASPAIAQKADRAREANPSTENRNLHRPAMDQQETEKKRDAASEKKKTKGKDENRKAENEDKSAIQSDAKLKGLEKQEAKKSEQVQKELGKGSERGQEARQERRKWWKFWGDKE